MALIKQRPDKPTKKKKAAENRERWRLYEMEAPGFRGYLPDPQEVDERLDLLEVLQALGLGRRLIGSMMVHDSPSLEVVLRMVERHGAASAQRRLESFIEETE